MADINSVILAGRLGDKPETITFNSGAKKASFSLATSKNFKKEDGEYGQITQWHNVEIWGNAVDFVAKLNKGMGVTVQGEVTYESYEKNGEKKYITKIKADKIFTSENIPKGEHGVNSQPAPNTATTPANTGGSAKEDPWSPGMAATEEDDLPF